MNLLNLYANGNLLTLGSHPMTTSGSVNYDTCAFNFNSEWKGFERTAVFAVGEDVCFAVELDDTGVCKIPRECLRKTGVLKIGVVGENNEGVIISTNVVAQRIVEGANNADVESLPADPETGDDITSDESAIHLLWKNESFELDYDFSLADYSEVDETDIHSVYNVEFTKLAEQFPTYVTVNVEGQDVLGNDIMSFTFTGSDYDRVILITANHFASSYMTMRALGGFFRNLCENYKKDANLNFLHSKIKFVVLPVVCPEAILNKSRQNSNGVAPFVNYDHFFDESPIADKGWSGFSEPETIPVITLIDVLSNEKCICFCDFESEQADQGGKKIYYKANDSTEGNDIYNSVLKFDSKCEDSDPYALTQIIETNAPIATNYATFMYHLTACTVVWSDYAYSQSAIDLSTKKYVDFIGSFLLDMAEKSNLSKPFEPKPFLKQVVWHSKTDDDAVTVTQTCAPIWISCYKHSAKGNYNVTLNGFATIESDYETKVRIKPVLYQKNSHNADFSQRFEMTDFDSESTVREGVSIIPFSSVLHCDYSNKRGSEHPTDLCAVIAAASGKNVKIKRISYILNAVPSDVSNAVELLSPLGYSSDYYDENSTPVFEVKYPVLYFDEI